MTPLSPKKRSELRAQAHPLNPLVIIGDKGLTDEVIAEIDRSLKAHELIKIRAATDDRDARDVWLETICARLEAHPVQQIGKVFVVYRKNPDEKPGVGREAREKGSSEKASKPRDTSKSRSQAPRPTPHAASATDISRPRSRTPSPRPASEPRRRRPRTSR